MARVIFSSSVSILHRPNGLSCLGKFVISTILSSPSREECKVTSVSSLIKSSIWGDKTPSVTM